MGSILLTITLTALFFIISAFALAFVYNNKKNDRCIMCGFKSGNSCIKPVCPKKINKRQKQYIKAD